MDKKKQIEEMATVISGNTELDTVEFYDALKTAKSLYNAGYRKIPEGSVVMTKFEYEGLKARLDAAESKNRTISYVVNHTQMETAREILQKGLEYLMQSADKACAFACFLGKIEHDYGVEVDK